jgi:hypothetical protein
MENKLNYPVIGIPKKPNWYLIIGYIVIVTLYFIFRPFEGFGPDYIFLPFGFPVLFILMWYSRAKNIIVTETEIHVFNKTDYTVRIYDRSKITGWAERLNPMRVKNRLTGLFIFWDDEYYQVFNNWYTNYEELKDAIIYDKPKQDRMVEKVLSFEYGINKAGQKLTVAKEHRAYKTISLFEYNKMQK